MPDSPRAFVSYSRADSEFALRLTEDLKAAGANVWLDQLDIEPGTTWDSAIEDALLASGHLLVILSNVSVTSDNVRDEISYALGQQMKVNPVLYQDCKVPFRLARLQHIDFRNDYPTALRSLLRTLRVTTPNPPPPPEPTEEQKLEAEARQRKAEDDYRQAERRRAEQRREEERKQREQAEVARREAELPKNDPTRIALEAIREALAKPETQEASQQAEREEELAQKRREERRQREQAEAARENEEAHKAAEKKAEEVRQAEAAFAARQAARQAEAAKQSEATRQAETPQGERTASAPSPLNRIFFYAAIAGLARIICLIPMAFLGRLIGSRLSSEISFILIGGVTGLILRWLLRLFKPQLSGKQVRPILLVWLCAGVVSAALYLDAFHAPLAALRILVAILPGTIAGAITGLILARALQNAQRKGILIGIVSYAVPAYFGQSFFIYMALHDVIRYEHFAMTYITLNFCVAAVEVGLLLWFIRNWGEHSTTV